jgi:hypothetical protein
MPGSVAVASVASGDVFPKSLSSSFVEVREGPVMLANYYHDGSRQASLLSQTSRKRFVLTVKLGLVYDESGTLIEDQLATLITFRDANPGPDGQPSPARAFYFYDPFEGDHDPTGASTTGRYTVVFGSQSWNQTTGMSSTQVPVELIEVV